MVKCGFGRTTMYSVDKSWGGYHFPWDNRSLNFIALIEYSLIDFHMRRWAIIRFSSIKDSNSAFILCMSILKRRLIYHYNNLNTRNFRDSCFLLWIHFLLAFGETPNLVVLFTEGYVSCYYGTTWPSQGLVLSRYGPRPGSKLNRLCDLIGRKRSF